MRRSVLFVCRGNICRSPLAQAVFEHEVRARGLTKIFYCDSRGTHGDQIGKGADPRAQMVATMHGLDLSSHRAHQIRLKDFAQFDLMLAMDRKNREILMHLRGHANKPEIHTLLELSGASHHDLKDPFRGQPKDFERTLEILKSAVPSIIDTLLRSLVDVRLGI